jgi:hypothetical protein
MKLIPNSRLLARWLCQISEDEYDSGRGLLSAVVVYKHGDRLGIPGEGFFKLRPMVRCPKERWRECWQREVERVFKYWQRR